jgi:hypothetical protein
MRNIDKLLLLPLFAALAISCSSPTSLQTSEYDDVYYSKKDKTIITENAALAAAQTPETSNNEAAVANPEYSGKNSGGNTVANGTDYYSPDRYDEDDYYYASRIRRFNAPYRGFSYYDNAYTDYYWYNRNPMYYGRSIYYDPYLAYVDPFYNCFSCYGYPGFYGGINIMIGRPFYNRWGYGNPYYGGYNRGFGYGGYGGYGGSYANSGWYRNDNNTSRNVQYGPRRDRSTVPAGTSGTAPNRPRTNNSGGSIGGGGGVIRPDESGMRTTRSTRGGNPGSTDGSISQPEEPRTGTRGRVDTSNEPRNLEVQPGNSEVAPSSRGRRSYEPRTTEQQPTVQPRNTDITPSDRGRRSYEPRSTEQQPTVQPRQQEQPRYQPRERTQESRPQPTYEAPQRQERTYTPSAPSSSPTYSAPTRSSGGSSGGSDGGSRSSRGRGN